MVERHERDFGNQSLPVGNPPSKWRQAMMNGTASHHFSKLLYFPVTLPCLIDVPKSTPEIYRLRNRFLSLSYCNV